MMSDAMWWGIFSAGAAFTGGLVVWLGVSGRWSKDDWPWFTVGVAALWPLLWLVVVPTAAWSWAMDCRCEWRDGDNERCNHHGDTRLARRRRAHHNDEKVDS